MCVCVWGGGLFLNILSYMTLLPSFVQVVTYAACSHTIKCLNLQSAGIQNAACCVKLLSHWCI